MGICFSGAPSLHSSTLNRPHYSDASDIHSSNIKFFDTTTSEIRKYRSSVREDIYSDRSPLPFTDGQILKWPELKVFSFKELKSATGNFKSDRLLGEGGFGRVYKGWLDEKTLTPAKPGSGVEVAIKMFKPESKQGFTQWQSEVNFLGRLSHPNVIRLLGYCWDEDQFLLVYEFMPNESFHYHLFERNHGMEPLSWNTRLKIVIGAARGLAFLHANENNVILRDFKSSNILLDGNYNAKLADFGLAKLGPSEGQSHVTNAVMGTDGYAAPEYIATDFGLAKLEPSGGQSHVTTRVMGTYGYAAPEYVATGHLYVKSDVYGFGVVLLEILTGMRALDPRRPTGQHNLVAWTKPCLSSEKKLKTIMDGKIEGQYSPKAALELAQLALKCLENDPKQRPSMKEVLEELEAIQNIH